MSDTQVELRGVLRPDGTLVLDEKPNLPPGPVTVVVKPLLGPTPPKEDWWQYMQWTRGELEAAGSDFMSEQELIAHVEWLREGDPIDELLRQADEERRKAAAGGRA
jgi:hypothetical protein